MRKGVEGTRKNKEICQKGDRRTGKKGDGMSRGNKVNVSKEMEESRNEKENKRKSRWNKGNK